MRRQSAVQGVQIVLRTLQLGLDRHVGDLETDSHALRYILLSSAVSLYH